MQEPSTSRYRILEPIGSGGMSVVYRALDTTLDRVVALKVLHPHLAGRSEARRRFSREAKAVAKLRHPNILEIFDYSGEEASEASIVTEFIRGETLRAFADREACAPPEIAAMIVATLADALGHAHDASIIHRDLKPENVMIREDGVLKLMDFGIAKALDRDDAMTMTGALVGSPAHMAPEIIEDGAVGPESDIWSLGTIFYFLCCGALPFQGGNTSQTLKRVLDADFDDPRAACPALSEPLARALERCLERDPAARFRKASELRTALMGPLADVGLTQPDQELARFFRDPAGYREALRGRLVDCRIAQAQAALSGPRSGRGPARAAEALNLALALSPEEPRALMALKALRKRRTTGRIALAAAACAIVAAAGVVSAHWIDAVKRPPATAAALPAETAERPDEGSAASGSGPAENVLSPTGSGPAESALSLTGSGRAEKASLPGASTAAPLPIRAPSPAAARPPAAAPTRAAKPNADLSIAFTPRHFARILLDGALLNANGAPTFRGQVPVGAHRLRIESEYCLPEERTIEVKAGRANAFDLRLQRKPATLVVSSPVKDALVFVDGTPRGTAGESERAPIAVPVPEGAVRGSLTIRLAREGYRPALNRIDVTSGSQTKLSVDLEKAL